MELIGNVLINLIACVLVIIFMVCSNVFFQAGPIFEDKSNMNYLCILFRYI